jgi:hypothetical protein
MNMKKEEMTKDELYEALYTNLEDQDDKEETRKNTLKTLLGVTDEGLEKQITEYNEIQKARAGLGNEDANETKEVFSNIAKYWETLHHLYVFYLIKLVNRKTPIDKILIYEAPPMPDQNGKINYILAESCIDCITCKDCKIDDCSFFKNPPTGNYYTTIKNLNEESTIPDILVEQGILFIDLCPLPLPMTTDIRKKWGEKLVVKDDKPLSIVLLELALKFALEKGIKISEKPIIAMGTPTATSQSIYFYFEKMKSSGCFSKTFISPNIYPEDKYPNIDFSKLLETNEKYEIEGQILPLYKSNIIAGSNTPNGELLKRIFKNP